MLGRQVLGPQHALIGPFAVTPEPDPAQLGVRVEGELPHPRACPGVGPAAVLAAVRMELPPQFSHLVSRQRRLGDLRFRELFPRRDRLFAGRLELSLQAQDRSHHPVEDGTADQRRAHSYATARKCRRPDRLAVRSKSSSSVTRCSIWAR
jgi:hypothetical protein